MKKKWCVIYTKSNCEKKAIASLNKKKIENYCPLNRIITSQGNKKRIISEPLFPSFVFVYVSEAEMPVIRQISCVKNFIYWLHTPAVIKDEEIEHIQYFTHQGFNINLEKATVNPNGIVKIISEPQIDINRNSILLSEKLNFKLLLPSLGYIMVAEIDRLSIDDVFNYGYQKRKMVS